MGLFSPSLLGNIPAGKGIIRASDGVVRAGEETSSVGLDFSCHQIL